MRNTRHTQRLTICIKGESVGQFLYEVAGSNRKRGATMPKAQSVVSGTKYDTNTKTLTVEVQHSPNASYSRSVRRAAWATALKELNKLPFVVRRVQSDWEFLNTWELGDPTDGLPCTTRIHYKIVE